jgi:Protein of unknown function (DUF3712)
MAVADGGVSTGNIADLDLSFQNIPLNSLNDIEFSKFLAAVTVTNSVSAELKGTADVVAKTSIGNVPISGIPFDVPSTLPGLNSFEHTTTLSNVIITGSGGVGGSQYIVAPLVTTFENPSNISLNTTGISLPTFFKEVEVNTLHESYTGPLT